MRFNFAPLLEVLIFFALIWTYILQENSFFLSDNAYLKAIYFFVVLSIIFWYIGNKRNSFQYFIELGTISKIFILFLILFIVNIPHFRQDLVSDQFHHAYMAILPWVIYAKKICVLEIGCTEKPFDQVLNHEMLKSFVFLLLVILIVLKSLKKNSLIVIVLFCILFFLPINEYRINDIHPPFRLFPLALSASVMGLSNFSFRIPGFVALFLFTLIIFPILRFHFKKNIAVLLVGCVATIPILVHVAYIVEPSIWTAISWSGILLFLFYGKKDNRSFFLSFLFISFASLMRASAFLGFFPLVMHWFFNRRLDRIFSKNEINKTILVFSPSLIALPYVFSSILQGSPATGTGLSIIESLRMSFSDFASMKFAYQSIFIPWIFLFPFAFCIRVKKFSLYSFLVILFFTLAYIMFYSIKPGLWGLGRYQAEFIMPFCILGLVNLGMFLYKFNQFILKLVFLCLFFYGIFISVNFHFYSQFLYESIFSGIKTGKIRGASEIVYDTTKPLERIKTLGLTKNSYLDGIIYGEMPFILAGFTLNEITSISRFGYPWGGMESADINKNKEILAVIISDWTPSLEKVNHLLSLGWKVDSTYENELYRSKTYLLLR
ncbi:glycosyltransferase family 39 protein [Leptospira sp. 85282-16]|uniref:glycosyltransferase family 39 protein n=1 Tax=Leptospira sp. 85282-16 TaxID=2971256 RepID=UPI0021C185FA|nr:glycosyltransferase family 39 protein [Leptospira sp. 85282-16]MCT8332226.1 glycosyltransferase family 39 protein [Leptospira sp. 85282-16]